MSQSIISKFQAGDVVRVRSMDEIAATLNTQGEFDRLPFMVEMSSFCGQKFRVARVAHSVCVNQDTVQMRRMRNTVVLQTAHRCDGKNHGGCQMGCQFLWKTSWLELSEDGFTDQAEVPTLGGKQQTSQEAKGQEDEYPVPQEDPLYSCQATALARATESATAWNVGAFGAECRDNNVKWGDVAAYLGRSVARKVQRKRSSWVGTCRGRTPDIRLGLKMGDVVRVKSRPQILETLDGNGCHRGLWFDGEEMGRYCGQEMVVTRRINRFIDESSGRMIHLQFPTVVLSEAHCSGVFRRFCSRGMLFFWREAWLAKL